MIIRHPRLLGQTVPHEIEFEKLPQDKDALPPPQDHKSELEEHPEYKPLFADPRYKLIWEADGFASVLPRDKREVVNVLKDRFGCVTGMTGDGVNDAPALSAAQVGIAVDGATDAAKNAAAIILTESGLSPVYGAIMESRKIFAKILAYVIFRISCSGLVIAILAFLMFRFQFRVQAILIILMALFNDVSMLPVAYDNAEASSRPIATTVAKLLRRTLFFALMGCVFSGLFAYYVLTCADNPDFEFEKVAAAAGTSAKTAPSSSFVTVGRLLEGAGAKKDQQHGSRSHCFLDRYEVFSLYENFTLYPASEIKKHIHKNKPKQPGGEEPTHDNGEDYGKVREFKRRPRSPSELSIEVSWGNRTLWVFSYSSQFEFV